jgi:ribosomal protein L37AE/L43A
MRELHKVYLRCQRCYGELTCHERTASGGYRCTQCGCEFAQHRTMQTIEARGERRAA